MEFALGYIAGIITAALIFIILAYFRAGIERKTKIIEKQVGNAGPRQRGAIFMPKEEVDIAREDHIKKNKSMGKDTPIDELR